MTRKPTLTEQKILDALQEGPLKTSRYKEFCQSVDSLKVHIFRLRAKNYDIRMVRDQAEGKRQPGSMPGTYTLIPKDT